MTHRSSAKVINHHSAFDRGTKGIVDIRWGRRIRDLALALLPRQIIDTDSYP